MKYICGYVPKIVQGSFSTSSGPEFLLIRQIVLSVGPPRMHYRSAADAVKLNRDTDEHERGIMAVQPQHHTTHTSSNSNNMNTTLYVIENVSDIPKT